MIREEKKPLGRPKDKPNAPEELRSVVKTILYGNENLIGKELKIAAEKQIPNIDYSIRVYQKLIKELLPEVRKMKAQNLDRPWHMGLLKDIPLESEVISRLFKLQKQKHRFSVRQVQWISRFHHHFKNDKELIHVTLCYTLWEIYCMLSGTEYNTRKLDNELAIKGHLGDYFRKLITAPYTRFIVEAAMFQMKGLGSGESHLKYIKDSDSVLTAANGILRFNKKDNSFSINTDDPELQDQIEKDGE